MKSYSVFLHVFEKSHPHTIAVYNNMKAVYAKSGYAEPFDDFYAKQMEEQSNDINLPIDNTKKRETNPFLVDLYQNVERIKAELEFTLDILDTQDLCHYTKLSTLPFLLKEKNENADIPIPKFRLSNTAYLNDPSEGQTLFEELRCADLFNEVKNMETSLSKVYIGSFSLKKDYLAMWAQYGDDSKGCCVVFPKSFFYGRESSNSLKSDFEYAQTLKLYKVHYCNDTDTAIRRLLTAISVSINGYREKIINNTSIRQEVYSILNEISFFFKNNAYSHEKEVRLVLTADNEANRPFLDRKGNAVPKLYMNVNNPIQLTEVILGSKVPNPSEIIPFLKYSGVEKVTLSKIPYR